MSFPSKRYIFQVTSLVLFIVCLGICCSKGSGNDGGVTTPPSQPPITPVNTVSDVAFYLTTPNQLSLLSKQTGVLSFSSATNQYPTITVDTTQLFQSVDGFGYTLTGGSAELIYALSDNVRASLLKELFSTDSASIGVSYLRISIGASDLSSSVFTYDDINAGATDLNLQNFSIDKERTNLIPLLKQILSINPSIKILACPWTAPAWMKSDTIIDNNYKGTVLNATYYGVFADYFVKYIQSMKAEGIAIDAITPQNEPLNAYNNPSMLMPAGKQTEFIRSFLGPKLKAAGISTKIITYDHNCDHPDYPLTVLSDATARQFVDGSAFHLYAGDISALTTVHNAFPAKNIYFTEQYTPSTGSFNGDLSWHVRNLIVGAVRNWSRNVLEWNLANDLNYAPHTVGGCTTCKGALTIIGNSFTRNVSYYIIGHASKFVRPGSVRVASNITGNLQNVAFTTPDGKKVLIVLNDNNGAQTFNIQFKDKLVTPTLDAGAVGTFVW